jgi:hypothetical protein
MRGDRTGRFTDYALTGVRVAPAQTSGDSYVKSPSGWSFHEGTLRQSHEWSRYFGLLLYRLSLPAACFGKYLCDRYRRCARWCMWEAVTEDPTSFVDQLYRAGLLMGVA